MSLGVSKDSTNDVAEEFLKAMSESTLLEDTSLPESIKSTEWKHG